MAHVKIYIVFTFLVLKTKLMPATELCKKVGADCQTPVLPHGNMIKTGQLLDCNASPCSLKARQKFSIV